MYKVKVNDKANFEIAADQNGFTVNGKPVGADILAVDAHKLHVLLGNSSHNAEVLELNRADKTCSIKVNGNVYHVTLKDRYDELLHELGMDNLNSNKISELKAPMPGLVLKVFAEAGNALNKGDNVFVLEAMKMENIIKSPGELKIKSIKVKPGDKVEKNQVLVVFE